VPNANARDPLNAQQQETEERKKVGCQLEDWSEKRKYAHEIHLFIIRTST
jgi:hypothetical protein